ncbi:hypothetical protein OIHEL45_00522 [Sulfitobacter indolifex HEL-45]|uniref:Peptidase S54 rhomboid domain-containing protein n=1 Tax=Sulfitobacter indolifex HEL-45 TaxID=391624 RepID=A0ABM9X3D9_9RHOB|nr:hypothetical protein OIHEL45_00522 [Sulfitobacter indolifex HEL-45]
MFPIRDHNPSGRTPYVTYALMAVNIGVFLSYLSLMSDERALGEFYYSYALLPARLSHGEGYFGLITSQFLHGGWMHLAGNMLFLWIFGDNVEDEMGHGRYLLFYLACGIAAGLGQVVTEPLSWVPMVGASGAIAGVMGGYLLLFPRAKVDILVIFIVFSASSRSLRGSCWGCGSACSSSAASGPHPAPAAWPIGRIRAGSLPGWCWPCRFGYAAAVSPFGDRPTATRPMPPQGMT